MDCESDTSSYSSNESEEDAEDADLKKGLCVFFRSLSKFFIGYGYIPNNIYTIDYKLLFILTAMYTSLVTQFRQAAHQEADDDVDSGRLFKINSAWANNSVAGGVSDSILWNCRSDSKTSTYYKLLYLGLLILYCIVIIVYLLSSVIINSMIAFAVSKLNIDMGIMQKTNAHGDQETRTITKAYLDVVANEVKITAQLRERLKFLERKMHMQQKPDNKEALRKKISKLKRYYEKLFKFKEGKHFYNWFTVLYIIPRFQTLIMLSIITLTLTSYDIHPIGCLLHIEVSYDETEESVTLGISENSILYKEGCIVLIFLLAVSWIFLKIFQFSLLPRSKWGLQIKKSRQRKGCCCPWIITRQRKNKRNTSIPHSRNRLQQHPSTSSTRLECNEL